MKPTRVLVAVGVLAAVLVGCGDSSSEPPTLTITGDGTAYSGLPTEIEAGVYQSTFTNNAGVPDAPLFLEKGGNTSAQFLEDFAPVLEGGPFPEYMTKAAGFATTNPGESSTATLTLLAGDYIFLSFLEDDTAPYYTEVSVTGKNPDLGDLPSTEASIKAKDYSFDVSGIKAGQQTIEFSNNGPNQFHHAVVIRFAEGMSTSEAEEALQTFFALEEDQEPPPGVPEPEDLFDTGVFSPGSGETFQVTFEPGTYAVLCFIGDRAGGAPHAIGYGMYEAFTVEG